MNIAIRIWIVILSFACITPVYANDQSGKIYYIDNLGGSDSNTGLSPGEAWKSFKNTNDREFKPGEQILLKSDCTWTGSLSPRGNGTDDSPIIIGAYGEGARQIGRAHV